jgi:hypothetical protein
MTKYEYQVHEIDPSWTADMLQKFLMILGHSGWDLVHIRKLEKTIPVTGSAYLGQADERKVTDQMIVKRPYD